ncbi:magnesium transporter [Methylovirgula ligni]|uniref:Magnesium transporter MgtE n=1 Tax=Methylovirgula ligni TaxID=569860 RepID=A0A3D9YTB8_9HYPH|nr:magnesium transporter [Methylovirgula ligni]QAY96562.1 magnesium transporter [Methylovirgula ligni]REF84132.1 magnesium transporter [Methylovirgula ligni]
MTHFDPESQGDVAELAPEDGEEGVIRPEFVADVADAVAAEDPDEVRRLAGELHEADLATLIENLPSDSRPKLIELMGRDFDFAALTEVDSNIRDQIFEELQTRTVAEGMSELEPDDALVLLEDFNRKEQSEILEAMPAIERVALQRSLEYPENSAGRLMQTTLVTAPPFWTAGQMIDFLRDAPEEDLPESFFEIFVVDPAHRLLGTVFLDQLLRVNAQAELGNILDTDRRRIDVDEDREDVARLFQRYNLISAPVVDRAERLVGVVTIDDVVDVIREEADEEIKALGGVSPSEELSDSIWWTAKSRFLWLFVNLITAFIASSVLGIFQNQLQKMVALAVLAPIVASQGGNAATQTMTVVVRALATRQLTKLNTWRVIGREVFVGGLNGAIFGIITGVGALFWFGLPGLGIVIAFAMVTNLLAGALGGILIPLALHRLRIDPAVSSGAFVTTVTDCVGYGSFLTFATLWFGLR